MGSHARQRCCEYENRQRYDTGAFARSCPSLLILITEGEVVRWSTDGSKFTVQSGSAIDVYTTVRSIFSL